MKPEGTNFQLLWTPIPIPLPRFKLVTNPAFLLVIFIWAHPKRKQSINLQWKKKQASTQLTFNPNTLQKCYTQVLTSTHTLWDAHFPMRFMSLLISQKFEQTSIIYVAHFSYATYDLWYWWTSIHQSRTTLWWLRQRSYKSNVSVTHLNNENQENPSENI